MIAPLQADDAAEFGAMVRAAHRGLLREVSLEGPILGWREHDFGTPIGLALARIGTDRKAEVLSVYVQPSQRGRGRGARLLTHLEMALADRGCTSLHCVFEAVPRSGGWARLLGARGWGTPRTISLSAEIGPEILSARWLQRRSEPGAPLAVFRWSELRDAERRQLEEEQAVAPFAPPELWPFHEKASHQAAASFGLRCRDRVVGWFLGLQTGRRTVQYSALFVREEFRFPDRAAHLFTYAAQNLASLCDANATASCEVPAEMAYAEMARLLRGKIAPLARRFQERWRAEKLLV